MEEQSKGIIKCFAFNTIVESFAINAIFTFFAFPSNAAIAIFTVTNVFYGYIKYNFDFILKWWSIVVVAKNAFLQNPQLTIIIQHVNLVESILQRGESRNKTKNQFVKRNNLLYQIQMNSNHFLFHLNSIHMKYQIH